MNKSEMPRRKPGKPPKFVLDTAGNPIVGLSVDKGTGTYFYTFYRREQMPKRPNFGRDYTTAVIRFREWEAKRGKSVVTIDAERVLLTDTATAKYDDGSTEQINLSEPGQIAKYVVHKLFPGKIGGTAHINKSAEISEDTFVQQVRQWIAQDQKKAQEMLGIKFIIDGDSNICMILLSYILKQFKAQPQFQVKQMPVSRKNELVEIEKTWKNFTDTIRKSYVGQITKGDINKYANACLSSYHQDNYSTTWVRKRFDFVKRVWNYSTKQYDSREIEQVRLWCTSLLVPPAQIIQHPPKLIQPDMFNLLLSIANPFEKAFLMLSMNTAYYATDIANAPMSALNWDQRYITYRRNKKGHVSRAAVLWEETIQALKVVTNHQGETIFWNPTTKKAFNKYYFSKLFSELVDKAVEKAKQDDLKIAVDPDITHSNCRDSVETICKIVGNGIQESCDAVLGHKRDISKFYTDANTYPLISNKACSAVWGFYFGKKKEEIKQNKKQKK
jgi:hypothetical protein